MAKKGFIHFALMLALFTSSLCISESPKAGDDSSVVPETQEKADGAKSGLLPEVSPYKYIPQEKWDKFLAYVANGGKWLKLNFYFKEGIQTQYFEAYEGEMLYFTGAISGAKGGRNILPGHKQGKGPHNHLGLFDVRLRSVKQRSHKYDCWMYWGLFYFGDHGFHAALKSGIRKLGMPDSHGCDRAFSTTAKKVYYWTGKDPIKVLTVFEPKTI